MRIAVSLAALGLLLGLAGCAARHRGPAGEPTRTYTTQEPRVFDADGSRLLRIGLVVGAESLSLDLDGPCTLYAGPDRRKAESLETGDRLVVEPDGRALVWRAGRRTGRAATVLSVEPVASDGTISWDETPYPGELRVDVHGDGLTLVDIVDLETYLRGVVPWEIGRPGPEGLAALAAQAVAARTYAVSHLGEREANGFDMWASVTDQVYRGLRGTDPHCDRAIAMTAGLVLRHQGREIDAYYSSTCGGVSSDIHEVWPRESLPYLISRPDALDGREAFCSGSPHAAWTTSWSAGDLERRLASTLPEYMGWLAASPARQRWAGETFRPARSGADSRRPGRLLDLVIERRTTSGRVAALAVTTEAGVYVVRGDRVRWVLAPVEGRFSILKSALFDLELQRGTDGRLERIEASGRGFGHGIGLCQTGALEMARRGYGYQRILSHYYPGAQLERAWMP